MSRLPFSITLFTLFPDLFPGPLAASLTGKALENKLWSLSTVNIRDFTKDAYQSVDDTPYGGGAGMVMMPDIIDAALCSAPQDAPLIYLSPRGEVFTQKIAKELAAGPGLRVLCGRYEGVDERVLQHHKAREISLGDFVLTGGELAAFPMLDAIIRLIPGVVGKQESLENESFENGLLEHPLYTKPAMWKDMAVPAVLTSGNHQKIAEWRLETSKKITEERRPDLWEKYTQNH
jgi:tRNA (guanine37-N1)-methyltransferase